MNGFRLIIKNPSTLFSFSQNYKKYNKAEMKQANGIAMAPNIPAPLQLSSSQ